MKIMHKPTTILITGCSTGIGLAAANTLQKRGYRVFPAVRTLAHQQELQALGFELVPLMDVNDSGSIVSGLNQILAHTGNTLDAVFCNAGYAIPGALEDLSRDSLRLQFETNVFGVHDLIHRVMPIMRKQGHGRIICNSSILGIVSMPFRGAYCASKFAVEGMIGSLRQELKGSNIFVSLIEPGPITTEFRANALKAFGTHVNTPESEHQSIYKRTVDFFSSTASVSKLALPPEAVVNKLIHALECSRPRACYLIGFPAHFMAFARRILSMRQLDNLIIYLSRKG